MRGNSLIPAAALLVLVAMFLPASHVASVRAGQTVIGTTDKGFYLQTEKDPRGTFHEPDNLGYKTGGGTEGEQKVNFRSFFYFHLPAQTETIVKVELQLFNPPLGYHSPNAKETLTIYDVSTPYQTVIAGGDHKDAIWSDLGSGAHYGSKNVKESDNNKLVSIEMSAPFVSMVQAGGDIVVGAAITSFDSDPMTDESVFNASGAGSASQLLLTTGDVQPDGRIRVGTTGPFTGDDVYYPGSQTASGSAKPGKTVVFNLSAQNDGDKADKIRILGQGSQGGYQVRYFKGSTNITAQVTGDTSQYISALLAPGQSVVITIKVKVLAAAAPGSQNDTQVTLRSDSNSSHLDVIHVVTHRS
jgi:hypothetical protein